MNETGFVGAKVENRSVEGVVVGGGGCRKLESSGYGDGKMELGTGTSKTTCSGGGAVT